MSSDVLTGGRIRERRVMQGVKQADLAKRIGISASYLNLIEHNRRRIGGKLLLDIASALEVEPQTLTDGAEAALLGVLGEAAQAAGLAPQDAANAEAFAGRFPGWADTLAASQRRVGVLERTVETLSDRMAHDPHLADAMHELLTTAAAVRSTAEILAGDDPLEREWQDRFHANLDADSERLAHSASALVGYLEQAKGATGSATSPHEEVEQFLAKGNAWFTQFDGAGKALTVEDALRAAGPDITQAARFILNGVLGQVRSDATCLPLEVLTKALDKHAPDPAALAQSLSVPIEVVMRRLAAVAPLGAGLVVCDRSGTVIYHKPVDGFSVPRFGSLCPLWPLFGALAAPGSVLRARVGQLGRAQAEFDAFAVTQVPDPKTVAAGYNAPAALHAVMLLLPVPAGDSQATVGAVGATCRICPHDSCTARREPSVLMA